MKKNPREDRNDPANDGRDATTGRVSPYFASRRSPPFPTSSLRLMCSVLVRLPGGHSFLRFQPFRKLKVKTLLEEYPFPFSQDIPAVEFEVPTELAKVANPRAKPLWVESGTASFNDTRSDNHERLFETDQRGIFNVLPRLVVDGGTAPHLREKPLRLLVRVQLNTVPVTLLLKDFGVCRSLLVQPHPLLFGDQST